MARASAETAAQTARQVLAVATELFAGHGYAGVSLDDIARAAGVTRGAVYHHYGSKAGLFRAVAAELQTDVAAAVATAGQAGDDAVAQLRAGSHAFLDAITAAPAVRVLLLDAPAVMGWAQWRELDTAGSVRHLRQALAGVGVAADMLDAMTAHLSGAMNEAALWLAEQPPGSSARDACHRALDRVLQAVVA
ncbi:TetR family transcriptional regulator [Georgenia sp. MJ170]|uniref:TetR family transcriptional regulator n=1 Tax=Georgenia sunbinii TaxID=3117728 RepID=UPI002F266BE1